MKTKDFLAANVPLVKKALEEGAEVFISDLAGPISVEEDMTFKLHIGIGFDMETNNPKYEEYIINYDVAGCKVTCAKDDGHVH